MIYKKEVLETMVYTSLYNITNYEKPIKQSNEKVFGKYVRRVYFVNQEPEVDVQELENWCVTVNMSANISLTEFKNLINLAKESCYEKDLGNIPLEETKNYTCYQLCDWVWLSDEKGFILKERKNEKGETVAYYGTLVKYAKILKNL